MTETERKALALVNEVEAERGWDAFPNFSRYSDTTAEALCRAIEQHEAFAKEVSDAVKAAKSYYELPLHDLSAFIIPPKPDPLVDACREAHDDGYHETEEAFAKDLRKAIEARGGKIIWEEV